MKQDIEQSFAATIKERIAVFQRHGDSIASDIVGHVNSAREIGILLLEWSQGTFNLTFVERHAKDLGDYEQLNRFVRIANRLPEPAQSLDEARPVMQIDFQTAGLLSIPESTAPKASDMTPYIVLCNRIGKVREAIAKVEQDSDKLAIKKQLEPLVEYYNTL